jgi:hypothetical protein
LPAVSGRRHFGDAGYEKRRFFTEPFAHKWSVGFEGREGVRGQYRRIIRTPMTI